MIEQITYEIVMDFDSFMIKLVDSFDYVGVIFFALFGIKLGLSFIRDSIK